MITEQDLQAAQRRLRDSVVSHRILDEKIQEVFTKVTLSPAGTVIVLVGVSGSGVTRVARAVRELCRKGSNPFNPFCAIELTAIAPTKGGFNWSTLFSNGLATLEEPILGQRRRATESPRGITEYFGSAVYRGESEYRTDFTEALQKRGCRLVSVLNAQFMLRRLWPEEFHHPLQLFHQLAGSRGKLPAVVLLSGTKDLLKMVRNDSGVHLCSQVVYVPNYLSTVPEDVLDFTQLLFRFQEMMGDCIEQNILVDNNEVLAKRTRGSSGWVKKSCVDALMSIPISDPRPLSWGDIEKHLPPIRALRRLDTETDAIREWLADHPDSHDAPTADLEHQRPKRRGRRVGERNPARDPVGGS